jgi:hypothetical protein
MKGYKNLGNLHQSGQFLMLIRNLVFLFRKNYIRVSKIVIYERDSRNLTNNVVKRIFLDEEKKRKEKKRDAYFCDWGYNELNVIKYLSTSLT